MELWQMKRARIVPVLTLLTAAACTTTVQLDLLHLKSELADPDYEVRRAAVTQFLATGRKRPLREEEIELLLPPFRSDPDWRIKVRISEARVNASSSDSVTSFFLKTETKATDRAPSANMSLSRLGTLKAVTKASVARPAPKK